MNEILGKKEEPQQPYALEDELTLHWLRATQSKRSSRKSTASKPELLTRNSNALSRFMSKIVALWAARMNFD